MVSHKEFLKHKIKTFLTIKREAKMWSRSRMSGGPMDVREHESYTNAIDRDTADSINRLRSRTQIGWYATEFFGWLTFWSRIQHQNNLDDYAAWSD